MFHYLSLIKKKNKLNIVAQLYKNMKYDELSQYYKSKTSPSQNPKENLDKSKSKSQKMSKTKTPWGVAGKS